MALRVFKCGQLKPHGLGREMISVIAFLARLLHQCGLRLGCHGFHRRVLPQYPPDMSKQQHRMAAARAFGRHKIADHATNIVGKARIALDLLNREFAKSVVAKACCAPWLAMQLDHMLAHKVEHAFPLAISGMGEQQLQAVVQCVAIGGERAFHRTIAVEFEDQIEPSFGFNRRNRSEMHDPASIESLADLGRCRMSPFANFLLQFFAGGAIGHRGNHQIHRLLRAHGVILQCEMARIVPQILHFAGLALRTAQPRHCEQLAKQSADLR